MTAWFSAYRLPVKNILFIGALVLALSLIGYLYQQLTQTQAALRAAEQRFEACEQVTFQLQNQLSQQSRPAAPTPPKQ